MGLKLQSTKRRAHAANRNSSQPGIQTRTHTSAPRYMITVFGILPDASKLSVGKMGETNDGVCQPKVCQLVAWAAVVTWLASRY